MVYMKCSLLNLFFLLTLLSATKSEALTCHSILSVERTSMISSTALANWQSFVSLLPAFPQINRESTHEDILDTIKDFRDFADQTRENALTLDAVSQDLLFKFADEVNAEMDRFSIWYNEFRGTWELYKTVRGIVGTASRIRAYYFEAKIGFLLVRSGFQTVRGSVTLGELRKLYGNEDSLSHEEKRYLSDRSQTEIDFTAFKDGVNYLIELKSYLPIMNDRFINNMKKTKVQMSKRAGYLRLLGLESNWQTVIIFEYEIEPEIMREYFEGLVDIHFGITPFDY